MTIIFKKNKCLFGSLGSIVLTACPCAAVTYSLTGDIASVPTELAGTFTAGESFEIILEIGAVTSENSVTRRYSATAEFSYPSSSYSGNSDVNEFVFSNNDGQLGDGFGLLNPSGGNSPGLDAPVGMPNFPQVGQFGFAGLLLSYSDLTQSIFDTLELPEAIDVTDSRFTSFSSIFYSDDPENPGDGNTVQLVLSPQTFEAIPEPTAATFLLLATSIGFTRHRR